MREGVLGKKEDPDGRLLSGCRYSTGRQIEEGARGGGRWGDGRWRSVGMDPFDDASGVNDVLR